MSFVHPKAVKAMQGFLKQPKSNQEPNTGKKNLKPTSSIVARKSGKSIAPTSSIRPRTR